MALVVATIAVPCMLCGRMVFDGQFSNRPTWLNQFRILYSDNGVVSISGVGYHTDLRIDRWVAPPNFHDRWDDGGYTSPDSHRVGVLRQAPIEGRWGVVFHEACWALLGAAIGPVPLERLLDLCRSFPIIDCEYPTTWGPFFGGEVHPDDGLCVQVSDTHTEHHRLCVIRVARHNPFRVPGLDELAVGRVDYLSRVVFLRAQIRDPFARLPRELVMTIAMLLPTRDLLHLRLASSAFTHVFYQQHFWASRFRARGERCWLFESQRYNPAVTDWRRLYRLTNLTHRSQAIHNRERVWRLALQVGALLEPAFINVCLPGSTSVVMDVGEWRLVSADVLDWNPMRPYRYLSEYGCVNLHRSQNIVIPPSIDWISFFVSSIAGVEYVVGIKMVGACGAVVELGYMADERPVDVFGKQLAGLCLAMGPAGIRAIQCVFDDGSHAPWIGTPDGVSHTRRLVAYGGLFAIFAGFDGCKITSLGIRAEWESASLRNVALWEDGIPDRELQLNEAIFAMMYPDDGIYDPVSRSVFGGTRGQSLPYLTGIQVYVTSTPCGIEFDFTSDHIDYVDTCKDLGTFRESELGAMQRFSIDGPGGERITGVELYVLLDPCRSHLDKCANTELESFKVMTNRGRSCHFRRKNRFLRINVRAVPVPVPAGETITGFYCTVFSNCINALGVITEMLD
ncbi:hypothetical protein MY11210_001932 [Beauveria gryllotalpidicola]